MTTLQHFPRTTFGPGPRRQLGQLTDDEWTALVDLLADRVLGPLNVAGSVAGIYSLYQALEDERDKARAAWQRLAERKAPR